MIRNVTSGESKVRPSELVYFFNMMSLTSSTRCSSLICINVADEPARFTQILRCSMLAVIAGASPKYSLLVSREVGRESGLPDSSKVVMNLPWLRWAIDCFLGTASGLWCGFSALTPAFGVGTLLFPAPSDPVALSKVADNSGVGSSNVTSGQGAAAFSDGVALGDSRLVSGVCGECALRD